MIFSNPAGLTTGWMFVYTIQPVVTRVVKPVWRPFWQARLSNRLYNPVDKRVERTATVRSFNCVEPTATVCSTGCQTGLYNRFDNGLYTRYSRLSNGFDNRLNVCIYDTTGSQTGLTTGLTTGWIVYTNINYNSQDRASIPASCGNYEVFITP